MNRCDAMRTLYEAGETLGGKPFTRNAIIGKINRLRHEGKLKVS